MSAERKINVELLRVISMAMIITLHCLGHGGMLDIYSFGEVGYFLFVLIRGFCFAAVNCFVLITGYFMVFKEIKFSRVINLIVQVEFYSVLCLLLTKCFFQQSVEAKVIFKVLFPLTNNQYWFATHYIILLALMPIMNNLIRVIEQKEHLYVIKILVTIFSVLPSFLFWSRNIVGYGVDFTWFIVLYVIGAYIRKYEIKISGRRCVVIWITVCSVVTGGTICMEFLLHKVPGITREGLGHRIFFFGYNSIIFLGAAVFLFLGFVKMKIKNNLLIRISGCGRYVFGAYLLSDHDIIRRVLWEKVDFSSVNHSMGLFTVTVYLIGIVLTILLMGCVVEYMRIRLYNWLIRYMRKILNNPGDFEPPIQSK